jgi:hypothetical protein
VSSGAPEVWSTPVSITKPLKILGAGVGQTVIQDGTSAQNGLLVWTLTDNATHELAYIEFENGGRSTFNFNGVIRFNGDGAADSGGGNIQSTVIVHHNEFDHLEGISVWTTNALGVFYENIFRLTATGSAHQAFATHQPDWKGVDTIPAINGGDNSWFDGVTWGGPQFLFIETNTIIHDGQGRACLDGTDGQRVVWRFNIITGCNFVTHGTDSGGRRRGGRAFEVYKNLNWDLKNGDPQFVLLRSGSALVWGNTGTNFSGAGNGSPVQLDPYRPTADFGPWDYASGKGKWDHNDPGSPFDVSAECPSRTCAVDSVGTLSVTVDNANFGDLTNYVIRKLSPSGADTCPTRKDKVNCHSIITSNTGTTLTFANSGGQGANMVFSPGDTFEINKLRETLDQPGRGATTALITGGDANTQPPVPAGWTEGGDNQEDFPVLQWLNTGEGGANILTNNSAPSVTRKNEHYLDYDSSLTFDGTIAANRSSIGVGTIGARPKTCTTGVMYWATDEGEWWAANAGADGRMYKCTATDMWTLFYTPYTYPHPLTSNPQLNLEGLTPNTGAQNTTTNNAALTGLGFLGSDMGASTQVTATKSGGSGVTISDLQIASDSALTVDIAATAGATLGDWDIKVVTDSGTKTSNPLPFTITGPAGPSVTSISPTTGLRGNAPVITINGTDLDGMSPSVSVSGSGVSAGSVNVISGTVAEVTLTLTTTAAPGVRTLTYTTAAGSDTIDFVVTPNQLGRGRILR